MENTYEIKCLSADLFENQGCLEILYDQCNYALILKDEDENEIWIDDDQVDILIKDLQEMSTLIKILKGENGK